MFGIDGKQLQPIYSVAKQFDPYPIYNTEKLGEWGILFLCCGAFAMRNSLWRNRAYKSDTFLCSSDLAKLIRGTNVCTSDDYAIKFSKFIKEWCNSNTALVVIEKRLEDPSVKMSNEALLCAKAYLPLAFMLNSLQEMSREKLLGFDCNKWVSMSCSKVQNYGWPELFFAAGFILNNEASVEWIKMASQIHGMGKSINVDVTPLFEHYAGTNPFLKSESTKIRTDQLKKGTRVRMRNGWEAIVVKKCDGNTLMAEVFGDFTETGSIYAHDIVVAVVDGKWVDVEMTEEQAQFYEQVKSLNPRD
jgi:hypothetical protein